MPGCLVAFEGTEGSGKTSQLRRAAAWLAPHLDFVVTREPGGTAIAEAVRSVVLAGSDEIDPATVAFLMNAARHDHCRRVISPALGRGAIVLTDRFTASTLAFQGSGDGVSEEWLTELERLATGGLTPHRNLLFDLEVEIGLARRLGAGGVNAIDRRDVAFHGRVRDGYHRLVETAPTSWTVINAAVDQETVWIDVKEALSRVLEHCGTAPPQ